MSTRAGIIAGGNWIVDRVKLIDVWPAQDSLASILGQSAGNGGSPYNILKNLAKLGASFPLEAVGLIGDDPDGTRILHDCRAHHIDISQLRVTPAAPTSATDVMTVASTGRRTFFHERGANARLGPEHFDFTATSARIFHLGYLLLLDRLDAPGDDGRPRAAEVLRRARSSGLRTSLDCVSEDSDRFGTVVTPVLPEVDILFANDFEAAKLTGRTLRREESYDAGAVVAAARDLLAAGVREWVIIHFPEAACACSVRGEQVWQPSVRVPPAEVRGAAGAGDAFAAGVLFGLHEDWLMPRCLELGASAAAASLHHPSCSDSVGSLDDCLRRAHRLGFGRSPG